MQASVVRRPHSSNIFSSETTGPIKVKSHMEHTWDEGTKVCSNDPGHMTKTSVMPRYGKKKLLKSSFRNRLAAVVEILYAALEIRELPNLLKC